MNMRHMLLGLAMVPGSLAGCGSDGAGVETETETRTDDAGEGGAGGFGGFPCTAPPEDVSASPRAEERIEMLALSVSPGLIARQADYDRIARDVSAIEAQDPSLRDFPVYFANAGYGRTIRLMIDASGPPSTGADAAAWDCLNSAMGVTTIETLEPWPSPGPDVFTGRLTFRGLFRAPALASLYAALPFVLRAEAEVPGGGDGSTICLEKGPSEWRYFFDRADGDCPAGCGSHEITAYDVSTAGEVTALGVWDGGSGDRPDDLTERLQAAGCYD